MQCLITRIFVCFYFGKHRSLQLFVLSVDRKVGTFQLNGPLSALIQSALQLIFSPVHTLRSAAAVFDNQEQHGVQCFAQGHFDIGTRVKIELPTSGLLVDGVT